MAAIMQFTIANRGGNLSVPKLSRDFLMERAAKMGFANPRFLARADLGPGESKTLYIDRFTQLVDTSTVPLVEGGNVPYTDFTIDRETLLVDTYGIGVQFTEDVEVYGTMKISPRIRELLGINWRRVQDTLAANQFKATPVRMVPQGTAAAPTFNFTLTGAFAGAATRDVQAEDLIEARAYLSSVLHAEPFPDGYYYVIAHGSAIAKFRRSTTFREDMRASQFVRQAFIEGEIGVYEGCRIFEDNYQLTRVLGATTNQGEFVIFGRDTVFYGEITAPEVRFNRGEASFNLNKALAWVGRYGYQLAWADQTGAATAGRNTGIYVGST